MNKENRKLEPELRFPKFLNDREWPFLNGDILFEQISNKKHSSNIPILAITQEHGAIPREKIDYNVIVTKESVESYKVVDIGDFIISLRSFQGGIEYSEYKGICSPAYIILRKKNSNDVDRFYKHYFKSEQFIRKLNKNIEGIRDGKMVSYKQFSDILLPNPNPKEQQKIADFLSSLDELVAAQTERLEIFKAHKYGLMQDLFPQRGETVPKLRFPEFLNCDDWEEKRLDVIAKRIVRRNVNGTITKVLTNSATNGIIDQRDYFDKDIADKSNLESYFVVESGDYVYNPRISNIAPVGPISKNNTKAIGVMSPLYTVFRFNNQNNDFYEYYFKSDHWYESIKKISNTGARFDRMSVTSSNLMSISVLYPQPNEQQKIADCLFCLDELINAQIQNIEHLKAHKDGLIQVIFPSVIE